MKTLCCLLFLVLAHPLLAEETPQRLPSLRVCDEVRDPAALNPLEEFDAKSHTIVDQVFEGLVRNSPEGKILPCLATKWERLDPLRVRFTLRQGVRFHDGTPLRPEDVKASIDRFIEMGPAFPCHGFIASLKAVDVDGPDTIILETRVPDGVLLNRLASFIRIFRPKEIPEDTGTNLPPMVGTGPFVLDRWEKGRRVVLLRNPDYWDRGLPGTDRLEFHFLPPEDQVAALLEGRLDIVTQLPGTETLRVTRSKGTRVLKAPTFHTVFASLNNRSPALASKKVRQALNHAIDRQKLIRYEARGNARPLASLTMPGQFGHNDDLEPYEFDPERARTLLAEEGVELPLKLSGIALPEANRAARILQAQLRQVGVELSFRTTDPAAIFGELEKPYDVFLTTSTDPMCHSFFIPSIAISSMSPYSIIRSPEFDERLGRLLTTLDPKEQERRARELDRFVRDQAYCIFIYQRIRTFGLRKGIDFTPHVTGMPQFATVRPTAK